MPHEFTNIVRIGLEVTRGTAPATLPLHLPFVGDGFKFNVVDHQAEVMASSTYPYAADQQSLGKSVTVRGTPDVNIATIRDIILMVLKRGATAPFPLNSFAVAESDVGVSGQQAAGFLWREATFEFSRGETPDAAAILQATLDGEGMLVEDATVSAGTQGTGRRFLIAKSTFTVNAVPLAEVTRFLWRIRNNVHPGVHGDDGNRQWMEEGWQTHEFELTLRYTSAAQRGLVRGQTEHAKSIVLATGAANETVTLAIGKAKADSWTAEGSDTRMERLTFRCSHAGAAAPVVATFGTAIGASVLGL